jgi:hypothetical protein
MKIMGSYKNILTLRNSLNIVRKEVKVEVRNKQIN